jgi:hypothetical protein
VLTWAQIATVGYRILLGSRLHPERLDCEPILHEDGKRARAGLEVGGFA